MLNLEIQLQSLQNAIKESTKAMNKVVEVLGEASLRNPSEIKPTSIKVEAGTIPKHIAEAIAEHGPCDGEIVAGFADLLPYNKTLEAQLYAVRELALAVDVVDDHVVSLMLKKAIKKILERELDIDFSGDEKGDVKPTIPQPKSTR